MEITFETEETVVLREGSKVAVNQCPACGKGVLMATPQAVAFLSEMSERQVFRLLEADLLHFTENGRVMVCLDSVRSRMKEVDL